ncbi:hypothetical protein F383_34019 [Gossypium arboreum]|uniref:Uncharacterized protein n=1 Tax=Gossypium arboreum TaxID=29729 RepID=A0A0B0PQS8_GOSAR|nr:hypothetical protein F383_34019 [Gossypium arboreum]
MYRGLGHFVMCHLIWPNILAYDNIMIHFVYGHEIWVILIIGL